MIVLSGADCVLADRVLAGATLAIERDRITDVRAGWAAGSGDAHFDLRGHYIVPGFLDVHVHGIAGHDCLDDATSDLSTRREISPIQQIANRLPRYGVTGFCPTTVACDPGLLRRTLTAIRDARALHRSPAAARVWPAHLESNFISHEYRGAQRSEFIRAPKQDKGGDFGAQEILAEVDRGRAEVAIVTLAPELDGALDLIRRLSEDGYRVSLGHSAATFEQAVAAIEAGACQATHLFNRMPPMHHRHPGLAGAVLSSDKVAAEVICDGLHVHPGMLRAAILAKQPSRMLAITDGTSVSGLPDGTRGCLGGRPIVAKDGAARLDDGTLAGSTVTMDAVFRMLVGAVGISLVDAAMMCSTTPARELGASDVGTIAVGALADLVVLDADLEVRHTFIGGVHVYGAGG